MSAQRHNIVQRIRQNGAFDVVVIGGGINGLGVYRELALQGVRVLLVEQNDFCSGCSAAPSRMIHGGLRYLENGEFSLVRESLAERDALLRNAPHMVRPLPTTIPIRSVFSGLFNAAATFLGLSGQPSTRGALPIKLGLWLYDLITRQRRLLPAHQFRSAKATRLHWPALTAPLTCSATYYDAWISQPERLGLELVLDTANLAPNSVALNYAKLSASGDGGFAVADHKTGDQYPVTARLLINASGAWLDDVIAELSPGQPPALPLVSGTKGSHLIIDNPALFAALNGHMIYFENDDGRVCIVFPYLGKVLAGSTDIRVKSASRTRCEPEERDYILASLRLIFPGITVSPDQIVFSYSGIRPLPASSHDFTGRISRGHFTHRIAGPVPQICMIGGKWTTFRAFAALTADEVLKELGLPRLVSTTTLPIGGGHDFPTGENTLAQLLTRHYGISTSRATHLATSYGTRATQFLHWCAGRGDDVPLEPSCEFTRAEIAWLVQHEQVVHLSDIVLRRTCLAITGQLNLSIISTLIDIMAQELGWSPDSAANEQQALLDELQSYYGVSLTALQQRSQLRS